MAEITIFPNIVVIGKMILGKYTKWIVWAFLDNEDTQPDRDLPKHPQIMTPNKTHIGYISSGFPANITNKK
jgi:hypothetical protein